MVEIPDAEFYNDGCEHEACGFNTPEMYAKKVAEGTVRAESFVRKVVKRRKVGNKRIGFGEEYIRKIHQRVLFFCKGTAGNYRIDNDTRMSGRTPVRAAELPLHMYKFGTWLEDEMAAIGYAGGNIVKALEVGVGAHYILTHQLHTFDEGNGRSARAALNGVLLWPSEELPYQTMNEMVLPVPRLRNEIDEQKLAADLDQGKAIQMDPYIGSIMRAEQSGTLNPFELYVATNWYKTIKDYVRVIQAAYDPKNPTDAYIFDSVSKRKHVLESWIDMQESGKMLDHPIPNYLAFHNLRNRP